MYEIKTIKINRPMPKKWREAIEAKREWIRKVQAGEIILPTKRLKKLV